MKVQTIRQWCETNLPPMAWQRIVIRLLPEFRKEGFFLQTIRDESTLSETLLSHIRRNFLELYQLDFPTQPSQNYAR